MPEYLAPGVYVEEVSFRSKSIEGVPTSTTGFAGMTQYGPVQYPGGPTPTEARLTTSYVEFERMYGGREKLVYGDAGEIDNYMWHAVRAFYEEGGKRLYVSRVFTPLDENDLWSGHARGGLPGSPSPLAVYARFPGAHGDARVQFTFKMGQSVLVNDGGSNAVPVA